MFCLLISILIDPINFTIERTATVKVSVFTFGGLIGVTFAGDEQLRFEPAAGVEFSKNLANSLLVAPPKPSEAFRAFHDKNTDDRSKSFSEKLDANKCDTPKTWRFINELQSRQSKSTKVSQIKSGHQVFTSPADTAEALNNHFTSIGQTLVREIPFCRH